MGVFDDQKFGWRGVDYAIPANKVLGAIARIEDVLTLQELAACGQTGRAPLGKLAQAYGAVLRYAGANVADDDVYAGMFGDGGEQVQVVQAVLGLLQMMVPRSAIASEASAPGKAGPTGSSSSKKRTRQRSA